MPLQVAITTFPISNLFNLSSAVLEDLRAKYLIQGWRNEAYPVSSQWDEDHYFVVSVFVFDRV